MPNNYIYNSYLSQYLPTTKQGTDDQCENNLNTPYCKMPSLPGSAIGLDAMAEASQAINSNLFRNATYNNSDKTAFSYNEADLTSSNWNKLLQSSCPIKAFYTTCSSRPNSTIPSTQATYQKQLTALKT